MEKEQIVKALDVLDGAQIMVLNRDFDEFQTAIITAINALSLIREQEKRIEELETSCTELTRCCTRLETLYNVECKRVDTAKEDTVRKMHDLIEERCIKGGIYPALVKNTINKVAEEMLEENT